jgi:hypothetical protein
MRRGTIAGVAVLLVLCVGCSEPPATGRWPSDGGSRADGATTSSLPPIPTESGGPGQAPVVWVGGTLTAVSDQRLVLKESIGSKVSLKRLGQDATAFYRVAGGSWERVDPPTGVETGDRACVETVLDGENLLALRVFLGVECGPAA